MNIKHNKIKNTGILFELLVRKVASDVLDGKTDSFAIRIMKEHFHPKSELGKELQLYRTFFNAKKLSETKAFNVMDLVLAKRTTLNEKMLEAQKFLLIKEIKEHTDLKQFMSGRVPSYKVYASIFKLFEAAIREENDIEQLDDVISSRFVVVEHLKGDLKEEKIVKESNYSNTLKNQPEEIRYLSYKILLEKFNEKYSVFSSKQKEILREYINNGTDLTKFSGYIHTEVGQLIREIKSNMHNIKDNVIRIKVNEVLSQLEQITKKSIIKESHITSILIACEISQELSTLRT